MFFFEGKTKEIKDPGGLFTGYFEFFIVLFLLEIGFQPVGSWAIQRHREVL